MKAQQLLEIENNLRNHCIAGILFLYESAGVGTEKLYLKDQKVTYSDGAEYTITALDWNPSTINSGLTFDQTEEYDDIEDTSDVESLPTNKLIELLEALEKRTEWYYTKEEL